MKIISDENGFITVFLLTMIFIIVTVMGAGIVFINSGNKRAWSTARSNQALYLAEAGIEKAIQWLKDNPDQWDSPPTPTSINFPSTNPIGTYEVGVTPLPPPPAETEMWTIRSTGIVQSGNKEIKVCVEVEVNQNLGSSIPQVMTDGIFARDKIYLDGSAWIRGPVNTNSTAPESVFLDWSTGIDGNVNVGPDGNPNTVITGNGQVVGQKDSLSEPYPTPLPLPDFPEFPTDLPHREDFTAGWWPSPPYYITDDGEYDKLTVQSTLIINVGSGTKRIRVRELSVLDSGKIILEGTGKLEFYVNEKFTITGSSGINVDSNNNVGDSSRLLLYYKGPDDVNTNKIEFAGDVRFAGSVYAEKASLSIGGSGKLAGSFVTGGTTVKIDGGSWQQGVLYAPNAAVTLSGSGSLGGTIVAKELTIDGGGDKNNPRLIFNPELVNTFPFPFSDLPSSGIEIKSWEQI
jgi:hypothetical protein